MQKDTYGITESESDEKAGQFHCQGDKVRTSSEQNKEMDIEKYEAAHNNTECESDEEVGHCHDRTDKIRISEQNEKIDIENYQGIIPAYQVSFITLKTDFYMCS